MRDDLGHGEDHVARIALLPDGAVDGEHERDLLRIGDLVGGHQPGAQRTEGVEALAFYPLAAAVGLPVALRHVIGETVAGDMRKCVFTADAPGFDADDKGKLRLPVHLVGALGLHEIVIGTLDAGDRLVEHDRVFRDGHAGKASFVSSLWRTALFCTYSNKIDFNYM